VLDAAIVLRDDAVLELLYAAGLRVAELCGIDRADLDLDAATVTVLGKGSKERRVPIHDHAVAALGRWLSAGRSMLAGPSTPSGAVFVNRRGTASVLETCAASSTAGRRSRRIPMRCATASPPTCSTGGGPARRPGAARPCQPADDPDLHAREQGPPLERLLGHPPAGMKPGPGGHPVSTGTIAD